MDNAILRVFTKNDSPCEKKRREGGERGLHRLIPCVLLHLWASCSDGAKRRRKEKHELVIINTYTVIYCISQQRALEYCSQTCCMCGPSRATELSTAMKGYPHAMVGAHICCCILSTATRKAKYGNDIDSPSQIMAVCAASQGRGLFFPKLRPKKPQ